MDGLEWMGWPGRERKELNVRKKPDAGPVFSSRRAFFRTIGGAAAATMAARGIGLQATAASTGVEAGADDPPAPGEHRPQRSFAIRRNAALEEREIPVPPHLTNGDEARYPNKIGNYSKGLPHNTIGEVDPAAYRSLLQALESGHPDQFEHIVIGGTVPLVDPQAGLAFDLEGTDCHQLAMGPPPALASAERAGEAVECYWMALLRDVNFNQYETDSFALAACRELTNVSDFRGPKVNGEVVVPQTLFRGLTQGDVVGPYVSQFLLKTVDFGAVTVPQRFNTYVPGTDYMTDTAHWLAVQNGSGPFDGNLIDPTPRYIRNGRDLSAYVHIDVLYEAYFNACLWLLDNGAPLNPGNPYGRSRTQVVFGTFGGPHVKS